MLEIIKDIRDNQRKNSEELLKQTVTLTKMEADVRRNADDLVEHKRRSEANEKLIGINTTLIEKHAVALENLHKDNEVKIQANKDDIDELKKPVEAKKYMYKKYMKIGGAVSLGISILAGLAKLFGLF